MKKARLYVRVSSDEQAKNGLSIPVQIEKLKAYCSENNYEIADIYIDNGVSAGTIKKRHEFVRMLDELQKNDTILITRLDRMSRNVYDANFLLQKFEPLNVHFKAILEDDIDTTTADGKFIFDLKVSLAERERKKTSERMKDIFDSKRAKGEWCGGMIPLGYKLDDSKHLVPHEIYKNAIAYIFSNYASGHRLREIRKELISSFGIDYSFRGLYDILDNKRYYGYYGDIPLISEELFLKAKEIRDMATKYERVKEGRVYLFQGLTKCRCGKLMYCSYSCDSKTKKHYHHYSCQVLTTKPDGKKHSNVNEIKLERLFISEVEKRIDADYQVVSSEAPPSTEEIDKAILRKSRLKEMYIEGFIDRQRFDLEMKEIEDLLSKNYNQNNSSEILEEITDIRKFYNELTKEEKRIFISTLIDEIIVENPKKIIFKFK